MRKKERECEKEKERERERERQKERQTDRQRRTKIITIQFQKISKNYFPEQKVSNHHHHTTISMKYLCQTHTHTKVTHKYSQIHKHCIF